MYNPATLKLFKVAAVTIAISGATLGIAGCNAKDPSQPKPPTPQAGETGGVIPQAQLDALNKAKNVETVLQQEKEAHDRAEQANQ